MKQLFLLLAFVSMSLTAFAQQKVSGKVTDSAGEPIIGASIVVKANIPLVQSVIMMVTLHSRSHQEVSLYFLTLVM